MGANLDASSIMTMDTILSVTTVEGTILSIMTMDSTILVAVSSRWILTALFMTQWTLSFTSSFKPILKVELSLEEFKTGFLDQPGTKWYLKQQNRR